MQGFEALEVRTPADRALARIESAIVKGDLAPGTRISEAIKAGEAYYQEQGDYDFHFRIAHGAKNRRIAKLLCGEMYHLIRIYRFRSGAVPGRAPQAFDEHRKILAALQARDGALAETLMRAHIRRARTLLEQGPR